VVYVVGCFVEAPYVEVVGIPQAYLIIGSLSVAERVLVALVSSFAHHLPPPSFLNLLYFELNC